jgi:Fe-S-cluster-containing dehydrogenase component
MDINRRDFLKLTAGSGLLLASSAEPGHAKMSKELPAEAVGFLYDATLCIGCMSCMVNCKKYNSMPGGALYSEGADIPYEFKTPERIWDAPADLSSKTLNIIKANRSGTASNKDTVTNGYSFIKQHCLHCISPACVSACPVGALKKDSEKGFVFYEEDRCIGCRYCQLACPFKIPKLEWEKASPQIRKCQLCHHRYQDGKYAACCEYCPTGASIFGRIIDLREEAKMRLTLKPGKTHEYPVQTVDSSYKLSRTVAKYVNHVYGLEEAGGTQYLLLAGVPFDWLGFNRNISKDHLPDLTWAYINKIPAVIGIVLITGAATWAITRKKDTTDKEE